MPGGSTRVAMLFKGTETYGIGSIGKVYAETDDQMLFVCMQEGLLVDWLRGRGKQVVVVPGLVRLDLRPGFGRLRFLPALARARRTACRLTPLLAAEGISIIHTHWYPQQLVAGFLRRRGFRSVWQINNYVNRGRFLGVRRWVHQRVAEWGADLLLPASDFVAADWAGARIPRVTVRNASVERYPEAPVPAPSPPLRCLAAGRLVPSKGFTTAVEAVLASRDAGCDVRLDIYGGPLDGNPYAERLQALADGSGGTVRLHAFEPDLRRLHAEYHVALQCRLDPEPCSVWVCEAILDGLPVIASATGGTPELIDEGESGHLVPPGDAEALSAHLIALARRPDRLDTLRRTTFDRGQQRFRAGRFVGETWDAYRSAFEIQR